MIRRLKKKNDMNLSIDAEKAFGKIHHPSMIKTINKLGVEGNFLNVIKNIYIKLRGKKAEYEKWMVS